MSTQSSHRSSLAAVRPIAVSFDERLWPVAAALLALAGLGAAAIAALADFHDPRWWNNGWTWLGSLAVVTLLLIWGVSRLDRSQRGLQLAAVLSLILHILLFLALNQQRMIALADDRPLDRPEPFDTFRAPDYHIRAPEDPIEEHEKPVATPLPEEQAAELERLEKQRLDEQPPQGEPAPISDQAPEVETHVVPLRQPEEAAPRLAQAPSELSKAEPRPVELSEPDPLAVPPQELAAELETPSPADGAVARRELPLDPAAPSSPNPTAARQPPEIEVAALSPQRIAQTPVAADRPATTDALTGRSARAPQLKAPQIADVPRAQLGVDEPLDEPQPLVKAPLRAGTGSQLPVELGSARDIAAQRVAVGTSGATESGQPEAPNVPRRLPDGRAAELTPANRPADAAGVLRKSSTPANVTPSPAAIGPAATVAARATSAPAELGPASTSLPAKSDARLPVRIPAPQGIGGVAAEVAPDVGTPSRRARPESRVVQADARLLARTSGGPPSIDGRTREPASAFARRPMRQQRGAADKTTEQTEAAIELGLVFLARHQAPDGSWSLQFAPEGDDNPDPAASYRAETAATGLALLSFLGAGYDHYGGQYAHVVQRALDHLIKYQRPDGDLYRPQDDASDRNARLYSHGIAAIALGEAYGMTGDQALAEPAQKAVDFIVAAQDSARGGWRYIPGSGSDTSVSGWQLMALKSGELAGLDVPRAAYDKVERWLDRAQATSAQYVYNPAAPETPEQGHGRRPSSSMTAVGLLMRLYTGLNRDDAHMIEGAEYLLGRLPENGTAAEPARDTYYWYYATQVMFHMRGKYWQAWNDRLHPLLVDEQIQSGPLAGSWNPRRPVPDRWGPHGGRIYVTTLNLLSLEVFYRHLPLYESTAQ
jgi:hypothetical protein